MSTCGAQYHDKAHLIERIKDFTFHYYYLTSASHHTGRLPAFLISTISPFFSHRTVTKHAIGWIADITTSVCYIPDPRPDAVTVAQGLHLHPTGCVGPKCSPSPCRMYARRMRCQDPYLCPLLFAAVKVRAAGLTPRRLHSRPPIRLRSPAVATGRCWSSDHHSTCLWHSASISILFRPVPLISVVG